MLGTSIRWIGAAVIGSCIWGACQRSSLPPKEPAPLETVGPVASSSSLPAPPPRDAAALPILEASSSIDASPTPSNATLVTAINTSACDDRQLVPGCDDAFPAKVVCP